MKLSLFVFENAADWQFKDYATALSIFITTVLAVAVTAWHNRYQKDIKNKELCMTLRLKAYDFHESFWNLKILQDARCTISVEEEYDKLAVVLKQRLSSAHCIVDKDGYAALEAVDQLYAAIMRLNRLKESLRTFGDSQDSEAIGETYGYWVEILRRPEGTAGNRDELRQYVERFWPGVSGSIKGDSHYGAVMNKAVST